MSPLPPSPKSLSTSKPPQTDKLNPVSLLLFSALLVLLQQFKGYLLFEHKAIQSGELWRILTGNLIHTNYPHLVLNLAGVLFVYLLFKDHINTKLFYLTLFVCSCFVGLGIYFFSPSLQWYAGLSGALYGLFFVAASLALQHKDFVASLPLLIGIPAKLGWDSLYPDLTQHSAQLIQAPVATDAHIYGLLGGIVTSLTLFIIHISQRHSAHQHKN